MAITKVKSILITDFLIFIIFPGGSLKLLLHIGLKRCYGESCIYMKHDGNDCTLLGLYVDDILIICTSESEINLLKNQPKYSPSNLFRYGHFQTTPIPLVYGCFPGTSDQKLG